MKTIILLLAFSGMLSCTPKNINKETSGADSSKVMDDNLNSESRDTAAVVEFTEYNTNGLLLPGKYKIYDERIQVIKEIGADRVYPITIIEKSEQKHPHLTGENNCSWSNYLKIVYDNDTLIVFGNTVLEIMSEDKIQFHSDTVSLLLADDFRMKATDKDGLTGCNDYSYMVMKSNINRYELIFPEPSKDMRPTYFARIIHDDGFTETIDKIDISGDTIKLFVTIGYQEGTGSYYLNLIYNNKWMYFESDRKRSYE